jgi:hypothetical protein
MLRLVLNLLVSAVVVSLGGCSDLGSEACPQGEVELDGICVPLPSSALFADPPPVKMTIDLGCTNDVDTEIRVLRWDLTVDPGPIVGGEAFGAIFSGEFRLDEFTLDQGQTGLGLNKRSNNIDLRATVHVRGGVTSEVRDVVLTNQPGGETCAFDNNGNADPTAGPSFPTCSPVNDAEDGSNSDCTGLGGMPDPRNVCGQFIPLPTEDDCDICAELNKADQCASNGFCITGDLKIPLKGPEEVYIAAGAGQVLFGWDDQSTDAILDDTTRPDDPMWILTTPDFDAEPGPNGFRIRVSYHTVDNGIPIAFECTMASGTPGLLRPTPDSALISFPIQTR